MMAIVEQMMQSQDKDAGVKEDVDRVIEIGGQFDGRNITKFLDAYKREMNQRDVSEACQISSLASKEGSLSFKKGGQHGPTSRKQY